MRESSLEKSCGALAAKHGWWHRKFKSPGKRSAPDRVFACNGVVFFVEFKKLGKKATDLQKAEHTQMRAAGLRVEVIDNREAFIALLGSLMWFA